MALLTKPILDSLIGYLKSHAPVDTGNLQKNGIQGVDAGGIKKLYEGLWLLQIGFDATGGYPATDEYALYTQTINSSAGWVNRAINDWWHHNRNLMKNTIASGVDNDELL